ncbi:hypothetical protein Q3G72_005897 [Acer saccharum]|nr:hypothetical protein Q3G72_005897 [Acer saccharum]
MYSKLIAANNADGSTQDHRLGSLYTILAAGKIILILCFAKSKTQKIGTAAVSVMQAGGVGLIFSQSGDNRLDPCVLIPCNKVGNKFFLTSEKQVLQLQSSDFPRVLKGTSTACPLVARIAALIKSAHLDWSLDAIRSALVTSRPVMVQSLKIAQTSTGGSSTFA